MRKIISKFEEEKRKRRNQFIVGGILIVVMLISTLGYAFQGKLVNQNTNSNITTYNGITFVNQNGYWATAYKNQRLVFSYFPSQINFDMTNITKNINDFSNKTLYLYSEDINAQSEIGTNMAKFAQIIQMQNLSSKDCSNNWIILQKNSDSVQQEQNCIIISGQGQDLTMLADNFLFKIFGIKNA